MNQKNNGYRYRIGIYVRESRDDNQENYETIETQRDLLLNFVEMNDLGDIYKVYIDDNVSGSDFERKGLEHFKKDVINGSVNLLVVKDLSRLGRNNAKTLLFLDFLEEYGVRVITFDGRYDSVKDNDMVGIDTWFNERYIRDISRKIRANLRFKIEKGEYLGHAPYGYLKSEEKKNKLIIDNGSAYVVKEIYQMYLKGYGYGHIAKQLNLKQYPSPSDRHGFNNSASAWNAVAVQRILSNRVYIGDTVQGVSEKVSFKSKKTRRLPNNKWVITTNTHEPIISKEVYEEVQKLRKEKRNGSGHHKGEIHLLKGILFCGKCNSTMFARKRNNRPMGYICSSYSKNGRAACTSHHISEQVINNILCDEVLSLLNNNETKKRVAELIENELLSNNQSMIDIEKLEKQIAIKQKQQDILYLDRLEGKISEELFQRMNAGLENKLSLLKIELDKANLKKQSAQNGQQMLTDIEDHIKSNGLSHEIVRLMVESIFVFDRNDNIDFECEAISDHKHINNEKEDGTVIINFNY